jgi:uncharacterized protein (DUF2336 family)
MIAARRAVEDLEKSFREKSAAAKTHALRRLTDMFISGQADYQGDGLDLFDDILCRFSRQIDPASRAGLAERFAQQPNCPPGLARLLAMDESVEVARPVLAQCARLEEGDLIDVANSRGEGHHLAIAERKSLPVSITDALVDRGNNAVALAVLRRRKAQFSDEGLSKLVSKAKDDDMIALGMLARNDIPRQVLADVFSQTSDAFRQNFDSFDRRRSEEIKKVVSEVLAVSAGLTKVPATPQSPGQSPKR